MATTIVERGLQVAIGRFSDTADNFEALQTVAVDDSASAFATTDTDLGNPTNVETAAFDATPTRSDETVTHEATFGTAEANFVIRRISIHNDAEVNVTGTSTTLCMGIDGQSITKTGDFSVKFVLRNTATDNS